MKMNMYEFGLLVRLMTVVFGSVGVVSAASLAAVNPNQPVNSNPRNQDQLAGSSAKL